MNPNSSTWRLGVALLASARVLGGLPADFPAITTTLYKPGSVSDGKIFVATCPNANVGVGTPTYIMVLNNDGSPVAYKQVGYQKPGDYYGVDFKTLPDGTLFYQQFTSYLTYTGGGTTYGVQMDENLNELARFQMGNGYQSESHDFQLLPNGHALMMGYYTMFRDLSQVVPGGYPKAEVSGTIIQELNAQRQVIWQWRSWDHFDSSDYFWGTTSQGSLVSAWHENVLRQDDDGDLFLETVQEVLKISRQTGQVLWRLGGPYNQFTFSGVDAKEGVRAFLGHDFHRLPNGNVLLYNNTAPDRSWRVQEYKLDEKNKIATYVWSYIPWTNVMQGARGSAERLPNGNTLIGWGTALVPNYVGPDCTEANVAGEKVWEMRFNDPTIDTYRAFRLPFPTSAQKTSVLIPDIGNGGSYTFANAGGDTGVALDVQEQSSAGYNALTVTREPFAPFQPDFPAKAPRLLPARVKLTQVGISGITATISFDTRLFGVKNPAATTIYFRPNPGQGLFIPIDTVFNSNAGKLMAQISDFGEFAFGFPDVVEAPYPPILGEPDTLPTTPFATRVTGNVVPGATYRVLQSQPILLAWSPKGFAAASHLQVSRDPSFASVDVDAAGLLEYRFALTNASPGTQYYWRVNVSNDGGDSDWASSAFSTAPPAISVTSPGAGVAWERGLSYFIQWSDNLGENVVVDLYKGGSFFKNIKTLPSTVSYKWLADLTAPPGSDYSLKISSVTNPALFAFSPGSFSLIDAPVIDPASAQRLPNGGFRFSVTAAGIPSVTVTASSNLLDWTTLLTLPLTNHTAVFTDTISAGYDHRSYRVQAP